MWKTILLFAAWAAAALVALKLLVIIFEPRIVFHPMRGLTGTPADYGLEYSEHRIQTSDGETVVAWRLPRERAQAQVLFFHGNAGNLSTWTPFLKRIHSLGFDVTALDYRGYGDSTGRPNEQGVYRDVEALLREFAAEIQRDDLPLVFWGRSLGGPIAAYAASQRRPDGLILESTFPSKDSLLDDIPLFKPLNLLSSYRFSTLEHLGERDYPVLVLHGDRDRVVPFRQGERLYQALDPPKRFQRVEGAGHNDAQDVDAGYWDEIREFVATLAR